MIESDNPLYRPGTEWLQDLPSEWDVIPLKYCIECLDKDRIPLNAGERAKMQGDVPYWGAGGIVDTVDDWIFNESLILLGEDGAPFDDNSRPVAHFVDEPIWANNHIHVLRASDKYDENYLVYALNSADYRPFLSGSTRDKLTQSNMKNIPLPIPSKRKQEKIANYLDYHVSKIGTLVDKKSKLHELIIEKKEATITEACTKGIKKTSEYKDSRIDPVGEIPVSWNTIPNRGLFKEVDERSKDGTEELLSVSHKTGITPRSDKEDVNMFHAESHEDYKIVKRGNLVINTMWAWMGAAGISAREGLVSPSYHVYEPKERIHPEFADYLYRTPPYVAEMGRNSKGVWKSRKRLYPDTFLSMHTAIPPVEEQIEIAKFLDAKTEELEHILLKIEDTINLLKEKRHSLTTAAVTGQIDLSNWDSQEDQELTA